MEIQKIPLSQCRFVFASEGDRIRAAAQTMMAAGLTSSAERYEYLALAHDLKDARAANPDVRASAFALIGRRFDALAASRERSLSLAKAQQLVNHAGVLNPQTH